jgi:2-(1,2-epoxy-1,2-dihydrophenyl)acetyl-CoA isomerase
VTERARRDNAVRVMVITGAGRGFCAGQDLKEFGTDPARDDPGQHLRLHYAPVLERLYALDKPTIAAVNGVAAGAGLSLALACDFRIASADARFLSAFVRIGLIPDTGATYWLPRLVGLSRAMEWAMFGEPVDAETAWQTGLVNRVVPAERLADEARSWAERLAEGPPTVLGLIKRAMRHGAASSFSDALQYEAWLQTTAARTGDHAEGLRAFLEKRPPRFGVSESDV